MLQFFIYEGKSIRKYYEPITIIDKNKCLTLSGKINDWKIENGLFKSRFV
jgi:hypothetical protein